MLLRHAFSRACRFRSLFCWIPLFAQTDDVVQQLYIKILQIQDRFGVGAHGEPVRTLAEFFGHTSAWLRDVLPLPGRRAR
jgi:hypothetical protein